MTRYGGDFGRWNPRGRYDRGFAAGGQGGGYAGGMGEDRPMHWQNLPGETAWMGEGRGGYPMPGYDFDYGGGFGSGYSGYGNDYFSGRGGYAGSGWGGQGGAAGYGDYGPRDQGYGPGYGPGGYDTGFGGGRDFGMARSSGSSNQMRAADIMTEEPETVGPDTTVAEVAQKMRDLDVGIIPVVDRERGRLRGVITDRDITVRATAEGRDAQSTRVSEIMTTDVETVNKNDRVRDVLEVMRRERVKRVPVTDREGRLVGIIAEADLLTEFEGREQERMVEHTLERVYQPDRGDRKAERARRQSASREPDGEQTAMRASGTSARRTGNSQPKGTDPQS